MHEVTIIETTRDAGLSYTVKAFRGENVEKVEAAAKAHWLRLLSAFTEDYGRNLDAEIVRDEVTNAIVEINFPKDDSLNGSNSFGTPDKDGWFAWSDSDHYNIDVIRGQPIVSIEAIR